MTDLIIKYIARVNVDTGQVESVEFVPGGTLPEEGISSGQEIVYIPSVGWESYDSIQIHEEFYRKEGAWVHRGARSNKYYKWNVETEQWAFNSEEFWIAVRTERNRRLSASDWTQLGDNILEESVKASWRNYRAQLRNLPEDQAGTTLLDQIDWPEPPDGSIVEVTVW
jgi:hypothetical protein